MESIIIRGFVEVVRNLSLGESWENESRKIYMVTRVAINGFGRIGRNILRAYTSGSWKEFEIVAINDIADIEMAVFLLSYDSVHGRLEKGVACTEGTIDVGFGPILYLSHSDASMIDWKALGVDLVLECTGRFTDANKAEVHLNSGAKKVLISAPSKEAEVTVVYGVNHNDISTEHKIVSNASCTTNCLAPVAQVLNNLCGIKQGFMTTIHSYTGDQRLLDANHSDKYRARTTGLNIIPSTIGAVSAVGHVLPELIGKLDGIAVRVPTPNVSEIDFVIEPMDIASVEEIREGFERAALGSHSGVLAITNEQLVSSNFNRHPASSIVQLDQVRVMPTGMTRVFSWYDNEWGFSNRMLDTAVIMLQDGRPS